MALCPICNTPGAYVGFSSVECRNPDCEHFVAIVEEVCPCCGQIGHQPTQSSNKAASNSADAADDSGATVVGNWASSALDGDPTTLPG